MNTDTGQIYRTPEEIGNAFLRNEPLVPVSENVAGMSKSRRVKVGNAIAQLKRTKPHLNDQEREELALRGIR